jgi:hypothetical protein
MIALSRTQSEPVRSRGDGNREARLQAEIVAWLREAPPNSLVFEVWNGGDLITKSEAAKRRWMGVLAGVADVVVIAPRKILFLEIKAGSPVFSGAARIPLTGDCARASLARGPVDRRCQKSHNGGWR